MNESNIQMDKFMRLYLIYLYQKCLNNTSYKNSKIKNVFLFYREDDYYRKKYEAKSL